MKFLTDEQTKLIEEFELDLKTAAREGHRVAFKPESVVRLLKIITLQNKALEKAVEQRNEFVDALGQFVNALKENPANEEQLKAYNEAQFAEYNKELTNIMEGRG